MVYRLQSNKEYTAKVTFSKELDTTIPLKVTFGSKEPYTEYNINGDYISETIWEGTFSVTAKIESGYQFFNVSGGVDKNDSFKTLINNAPAFKFNVDNTQAQAMLMQANEYEGYIHLSWMQDDYDTLMGYNIYRSDEKDGNYVKINPSVIPNNENEFIDDNAEPGKKYWYTFTVVLSDMTESNPAGKVSCTAYDSIAPNIYHQPVNQGYLNNNLVISCTASDNVSVENVTLYYRVTGNTEWKSLKMSKQNDRFSATIFGNELSLLGIEYYISAKDTVNTIYKGSSDNPFTIIIKDSSALSKIGDVDGDGTITTKDALMIIQTINGDRILSDDEFIRADLNSDGILSSVEALRILQYINGNVNTLKM